MTRRLSDFVGVAGLKVLRDGPFETTGKLWTRLDGAFVPVRKARYVEEANRNPHIAAVVTPPALADAVDERLALGTAERPEDVHSGVHAVLAEAKDEELRQQPTRIDTSAVIDPGAAVSPYGAAIGARVRVGANAVIGPGVEIAEDCVLHPGVVLGVPGFNRGIVGGRRRNFASIGGVRLMPFVELLANTCVARALFGGDTTIDEEVVTDNLVYIAHDARIGRRAEICALANILGRAEIGENAYIGPSAVVLNGVTVGRGARVSVGSVVTRDVPPGETVTGNFALPHDRFIRHLRSVARDDP